MKRTLLKLLIFCCLVAAYSQDLGRIGKDKKPVKINGSISANQVMAGSFGIPNRRPPYNYFLSGSLTVSIYGWSVPVSYTFSNQQSQFQQPFNQYGITPYYKWVKLYAGYSTMQFSNYTLNNHIFLGGGIQLTPGIFRFSAMYGRLNIAIKEDTNNTSILPFYERMGMAMKAGIGKDQDFIDCIFFKADDNPTSIPDPLKAAVTPAQNVILSANASKKMLKYIVISGEYASSAFTADIRNASVANNNSMRYYPGFNPKSSSSQSSAYNLKAQFTRNGLTLGVGFERVDPEYRTLGSYFFNTDFENLTANAGRSFLKGRLNVNGSFGQQRSNLKNDKLATMVRNIYSLSIAYTLSTRLTVNASYSNFLSVSRIRSQFENLTAVTPQDTLRLNSLDFVQTTQNVQGTAAYTLSDPSSRVSKSSLMATFNVQDVGQTGPSNQRVREGTRFYNSVLSFNTVQYQTQLNYTFSLNVNVNQAPTAQSLGIGPTASASKTWFGKKLKSTVSVSWLNSFINRNKTNDIFNYRLLGSYTFRTKHMFNLAFSAIHRLNYALPESRSVQPNFWELNFNSGYSYTF